MTFPTLTMGAQDYIDRHPTEVPMADYLASAANSDWDDGYAPPMPAWFNELDPHNVIHRRTMWTAGFKAGRKAEQEAQAEAATYDPREFFRGRVILWLLERPNWQAILALGANFTFWGGAAWLLWRMPG